MIDPSFVDVTDAELSTMESPERFLERSKLEIKVADLENKLRFAEEHWEIARQRIQTLSSQIESFETALKHNEWDFDSDTLESLADFFDITLEREYDVTITVTFTGTVSAPYDYDIDGLENDLQATIDTHYYSNGDVDIDLSEDSMEIDYREV